MFTNKGKRFQRSCVIETGLSDIHKMTITVLKMQFRKLEPKVVSYRNYKNFSNDVFLKSLNCLNIPIHQMRMDLIFSVRFALTH